MPQIETESIRIYKSQRDLMRGIQDEVEEHGAHRPSYAEILDVWFSVKHRHYVVDTLIELLRPMSKEAIEETVSRLRDIHKE